MTIPISRWGKDHWSTLGYVECRIVDNGGVLDRQHMRCDPDIHPQFANRANRVDPDKRYPTRLNDGVLAPHDDWSCIDDMVAEGILERHGSGMNPIFKLTDLGKRVAAKLRSHKAEGGSFSTYTEGGS